MTIPNHKIVVHDESEINYPFREKSNKIEKPFIFKGYKNEIERIKDSIKKNGYSFKYLISMDNIKINNTDNQKEDIYDFNIQNPDSNTIDVHRKIRRRSSLFSPEQLRDLAKKEIIIQPTMKFTARTDLERVYDAINKGTLKNKEKNILRRQLKNINLYNSEKPMKLLKKMSISENQSLEDELIENERLEDEKRGYKIKPNPFIDKNFISEDKINKNIYSDGNLYYIPKKEFSKPWKKKIDLNSEAEKILSEYHKKTHFKAVEEVAEKKLNYRQIKSVNNSIFHKKYPTEVNLEKNVFSFDENDDNIKYDNYSLNKNPFDIKNNFSFDPESLNALSKIAFKDSIIKGDAPVPNNTFHHIKYNHFYHKKKLVDENNVLIDGQLLYKDSQFDIIANRVLKMCNVYKKKSNFNNTKLVKGKGKLMVTKGLSLNQFEKKYNYINK
jgi:hypothetical protein